MNSVRRLCFPLLSALFAFLMVSGMGSAATFTLQDLATVKTVFLNEGGFNHDLLNPLQVTISNAAWSVVGDIRLVEPGRSNITLSDVIRFVNVNGVATIYFGSDDVGTVLLTGPLAGPSPPGFSETFSESTPASLVGVRAATTSGVPVIIQITGDDESTAAAGVSDHIQLTATAPQVPEPSTFTLAGLGALGLLIKSFRRNSCKQ